MIIEQISQTECYSTLAQARLARLACAHENQPYVVPAYLVYERPYLYGFTTLGQKVEWMRLNPLVCVEVDDIVAGDQWISIIAFGRYEELPDTPEWQLERLHAHKLLQRFRGWWEVGTVSHTHRKSQKPVTPVFYRIRIDSISGRRAKPAS
jgi:nitroimidazol reductase NimA-like FMN-containing flavoprotein (pyridoxamine 5'-phosphate oxidase superfamily)